MIYVTGDTHGDTWGRMASLPEDATTLIICGDFGGIWDFRGTSELEEKKLDAISSHIGTLLFVDGNHENHERLNSLPIKEWNGGKVHVVRDNILHLMRGEVFNIEGNTIFTMGGARSHDIQDGILIPGRDDEEINRYWHDHYYIKTTRVEGQTIWYNLELPSEEEMQHGIDSLNKVGNKVDYIITHDTAMSTIMRLYGSCLSFNSFNDYLEQIKRNVSYKGWYFGHHHDDERVSGKERMLYHDIVKLGCLETCR